MLNINLKFESDQDFIMTFGKENVLFKDIFAETDYYVTNLNASEYSFSFSFKGEFHTLEEIKKYVNSLLDSIKLKESNNSNSSVKMQIYQRILKQFKKELNALSNKDVIMIGGNQYISLYIFEKEIKNA